MSRSYSSIEILTSLYSCRTGWAEGKSIAKKPERFPLPCENFGFHSTNLPSKSKLYREDYQAKLLETAQIHVSFISKQVNFLVSESTLRGLFGTFGEIVDVALKKTQFDQVRIENEDIP